MEIIGLAISIVALLFAVFTYFKHDLKIKQQASILNKYQLEKIEKEKVEKKRAIIEANVIKSERGVRKIKVYNKGKSIARNVNVLIPDIGGFEVTTNPCPIEIRPQNGIEISLIMFTSAPDKLEITFEWADDYRELNTERQTIQI